MANNLIEHNGYNIGKSLKEENVNSIIDEILSYSKEKNCNIIFPEDVVVANDLNGQPQIKELNQIKLYEMILDIGPKLLKVYVILLIIQIPYYGMVLLDILKILISLMEVMQLQKK